MPPAPERLSMATGTFHLSLIISPISRAKKSALLPGVCGTMTRTGFKGNSVLGALALSLLTFAAPCAAAAEHPVLASSTQTLNRRTEFVITSYLDFDGFIHPDGAARTSDQSNCAPDCLATVPHLDSSSRMNALNCSGVPSASSAPSASSGALTSTIRKTCLISRFRRSTTDWGVPAGAKTPYHC